MKNNDPKVYGKGRVLKKDGKRVEMNPKKWLIKDLEDFYRNSGLTGVGFTSFDVPDLDFGSKNDEEEKKERERIIKEIEASENPIELVVPVVRKTKDYEKVTNDFSLLIFTPGTKTREKLGDKGISKSSQLQGMMLLVPKKQNEIKLSSKKVEELKANGSFDKYNVDDKGNLFKYYENISGETIVYVKETIDLSQVQLVKRITTNNEKNTKSRFSVVANKIDDNWNGKFDNVVKGQVNKNTYYVNLGDNDSFNKNWFIAKAIVEVYGEKREKAPAKVVKVNENLPKFIESSEEGVYGYWDCGIIPIAVVGDSKARPYHEAKKTQKASKKSKSMNKTNAKIEKEIREIDEWLEVNRRVADKGQVVKKENRRAELVDKITEDRQVRIYAVEAKGGNKKIDYFAYIGDDRHAPKTSEDFKTNSNVYKVRKEGFKFLNATKTPIVEVYGKPLEDENGKITYSDIRRIVDVTPGGNKELVAFFNAFAEAERGNEKFKDVFYNHISDQLAVDLQNQKNERNVGAGALIEKPKREKLEKPTWSKNPEEKKRQSDEYKRKKAELDADYNRKKDERKRNNERVSADKKRTKGASSGRKSGGILKIKGTEIAATLALCAAIGLGVGVGLTAVGQVPGYAVDATNENYVRTVVEAETENILSNGGQEEQNKNDSGAVAVSKGSKTASQKTTLFKYEVVNKEGNVKVVPSDDSNIQKMFDSETNPATFGVPAKEIGKNAITGGRKFWARLAVTNWKGLDYSKEGVEGAFSALGEMAGEEVKANGVNLFKNNQLTKNEVIYPNGTTNPESLERQLRDLGASEEEANAAVSAYANSFIQAYMESENQVVVDEEEDGYDITDGNLQETVSTVLGEDVQVINANYNDSTKKVSIFGVDNDNNLIGVECNNNLGIKITSAEGIETVLLDAAEKDSYETTEYKPFNDLNLSESYKNKAYNYLGNVYGGEIASIYYDITPTKADGTNDAHYDTTIVSVAESNLDVTVENINVYSDTHQTVTAEDVVKTALSEITEGKLAGAISLYTKTGEATDRTTIKNQLDAKTIEQSKNAIEDIILQTNEWTAYVPSGINPGREK